MHFKTKLKVKVLLLITIVAVPLVATTFLSYFSSKSALDKSSKNEYQILLTEKTNKIEQIFSKTANDLLISAQNPSLKFYSERSKETSRWKSEQQQLLKYLRSLFPMLDEACIIDSTGRETNRIVFDEIAADHDLSSEEESAPFFNPTFSLNPGEVYQSEPYISADTERWVASSTTPIVDNHGAKRLLLHFEIDFDYFRREISKGLKEDSFALILDNKDHILIDTRKEANLKDKFADVSSIFGDDAVKELNAGLSGQSTVKIDDRSYLLFYSSVNSSNPENINKWKLVIAVPSDVYNAGLGWSRYLLIIALLGLLISFLLASYIGRSITDPILELANTAKEVAAGNLAKEIAENRSDELGVLAGAFNSMVRSMRNMIKNIMSSAHELSTSSVQLNMAAEDISVSVEQSTTTISQLAVGITEQNTSIENVSDFLDKVKETTKEMSDSVRDQAIKTHEISGSIERLSLSVEEVTNSTNTVKSSVESSRKAAEEGRASVNQTIKEMEKIREIVLNSTAKIEAFDEKNNQIGEITKVINDIADQTNLLALNAAIEAARAGEHGQGFAVVADEVRKLAERSSKASNEIAQLITSVQKESADTMAAMEEGSAEVEKGVTLASQAGDALEKITASVDSVAAHINQVVDLADDMNLIAKEVDSNIEEVSILTERSAEQTARVVEATHVVAEDVSNVAAISQSSAAAAQEIAATSEEQSASIAKFTSAIDGLATMAQNLQQLTSMNNKKKVHFTPIGLESSKIQIRS